MDAEKSDVAILREKSVSEVFAWTSFISSISALFIFFFSSFALTYAIINNAKITNDICVILSWVGLLLGIISLVVRIYEPKERRSGNAFTFAVLGIIISVLFLLCYWVLSHIAIYL